MPAALTAAALLRSSPSAEAPPSSAAPDAAAFLTATPVDGKVIVEYRFPEGAMGVGLLYRSFQDLGALGALELRGHPISKHDLGPVASEGCFVDSLAAEGRTYLYYLQAKQASGRAFPCKPARVAVPPRPLAPGACAEGCHLFVDKRRFVLEVRRGPALLKRYPVNLGRDPVRRKHRPVNAPTPEGTYRISYLKPESQFHKSGSEEPAEIDGGPRPPGGVAGGPLRLRTDRKLVSFPMVQPVSRT